jgi:hypothetical protein
MGCPLTILEPSSRTEVAASQGDGATVRHHTAETGTAATGRSSIPTAKRSLGTVGKERGIVAGNRKAKAEQRIQPSSPSRGCQAPHPPCATPSQRGDGMVQLLRHWDVPLMGR